MNLNALDAGRRSPPSWRRSPACPRATATAARYGGGRPRRRRGSAACTPSSARSDSRPSGSTLSLPGARAGCPLAAAASWRTATGSRIRSRPCALAVAVEELELNFDAQAVEHDGGRVTGVRGRSRDRLRAGGDRGRPGVRRSLPAERVRRCRSRGRSWSCGARRAAPLGRIVRTPRCYLVPRTDGRVVVGATVEEQGFDTAVTADGVSACSKPWEVLPEVGELECSGSGRPPRHADNMALVGPGARRARVGHRPLAQRGAARPLHRRGRGRDPHRRGAA